MLNLNLAATEAAGSAAACCGATPTGGMTSCASWTGRWCASCPDTSSASLPWCDLGSPGIVRHREASAGVRFCLYDDMIQRLRLLQIRLSRDGNRGGGGGGGTGGSGVGGGAASAADDI